MSAIKRVGLDWFYISLTDWQGFISRRDTFLYIFPKLKYKKVTLCRCLSVFYFFILSLIMSILAGVYIKF